MSATTSSTPDHSENDADKGDGDGDQEKMKTKMYLRFGAMILTSTTIMFILMYSTIWAVDHARWSEMRFYMALFMGGMMTIVMMGFMWGMYKDTKWNIGILLVGLAFFSGALWLARSQFFVDDEAYMKAMIPHHSIAILTSERADLDDVRVCQLAVEISEAQRREIDEMDWLVEDINENGVASTVEEAQDRPIPEFDVSVGRECPGD